ncbi:hypothetical protein [Bacillus sp. SG-1]|uniref:hypothetical protein n=1 Tax=Bacillus sp. SG-1 TaxID=161544 RepID=UPI0001544221|nr:hypothetical protein [Bacillus sp. SG-1]EDL65742.1 hypothetical protein BSG1_12746 [Bacillus sp. SG-1]
MGLNSQGHSLGIIVFTILFAVTAVPMIFLGTNDVNRYEEIGKNVSVEILERLNREGYKKDDDNTEWSLDDVKLSLAFSGKGKGNVKTTVGEYGHWGQAPPSRTMLSRVIEEIEWD